MYVSGLIRSLGPWRRVWDRVGVCLHVSSCGLSLRLRLRVRVSCLHLLSWDHVSMVH